MPIHVALNPEVVKTFLASISYILSATKSWFDLKDRAEARKAGMLAESLALGDSKTDESSKALLNFIGPEMLEGLMARVEKCKGRLSTMLNEEGTVYFPEQISDAIKGPLPNCVCGAISDMVAAAGPGVLEVYPDLKGVWQLYNCDSRTQK